MGSLELITTEDGSHTLLNTEFSETYHSRRGAVQESLHVFIREGLAWYAGKGLGGPIRVFEMGFGTGLNAFLALHYAIEHEIAIAYHGIDTLPLDAEVVAQLNYAEIAGWPEGARYLQKMHAVKWNVSTALHPGFTFIKTLGPIQDYTHKLLHNDIIFYDAFAPSKQASVWEFPILAALHDSMKRNGILVTYCSSGQFKRDLAEAGFSVEVLPGPPGKREMVRAVKS